MTRFVAALAHLRRRKLRTALTVAGIAVGIFALTVVGALAEQLSLIVTRSTTLDQGTVLAFAPHGAPFVELTPRLRKILDKLAADPDIAAVYPDILLPYSVSLNASTQLETPALVLGLPDAARAMATRTLRLAQGRMPVAGESRTATVGGLFARKYDVQLGSVIALYGNSYTVVGIEETSFTLFDQSVIVPFADARALLLQFLPPGTPRVPHRAISSLLVLVKPHVSTAIVARRVSLLSEFSTRDPAQFASALSATLHIFDTIVFGAATMALLIAAFSVVNTMTIAVSERTREIGIRKSIGARDGDILLEILMESALIGGFGAGIGIAAGFIATGIFDAQSSIGGGIALFALTPGLGAGAFLFGVILSLLAGLPPAIRAARLDPVQALRQGA